MIVVEQLLGDTFAPFGDVVDYYVSAHENGKPLPDFKGLEAGFAEVAKIEGGKEKGAAIDLLRLAPQKMPVDVSEMMRVKDATVSYFPIFFYPLLFIVALPGKKPDSTRMRGFVSTGNQGVTLKPGIWHHPPFAVRRGMSVLRIAGGGVEQQIERIKVPRIKAGIPGVVATPAKAIA